MRKIIFFELFLLLAASLALAAAFPHLSAQVATHWGVNGAPNGYTARGSLWVVGPGLIALITVVTVALPWLSPGRFTLASFRSTYHFIMGATAMLLAYIFAVILWIGMGHVLDVMRAVSAEMCLFIAVLGNVLGKVQSNFFIGIRTPWTLASEKVWYATHRFGAKCFVAAGILGFLLALVGFGNAPILVVVVGALLPVGYSLYFYKLLERRGQL